MNLQVVKIILLQGIFVVINFHSCDMTSIICVSKNAYT